MHLWSSVTIHSKSGTWWGEYGSRRVRRVDVQGHASHCVPGCVLMLQVGMMAATCHAVAASCVCLMLFVSKHNMIWTRVPLACNETSHGVWLWYQFEHFRTAGVHAQLLPVVYLCVADGPPLPSPPPSTAERVQRATGGHPAQTKHDPPRQALLVQGVKR